jgi:hypothetical protein
LHVIFTLVYPFILPQVFVRIDDINDNCPVFHESGNPVYLTVVENSAPGPLYTFNVTDGDAGAAGQVTFFLNDTGKTVL